jgi:hypothetical protein
MSPTGHWNRIEQRVGDLWPQDVLEQEKRKLEKAGEVYHHKVTAYVMGGGTINQSHDWVFNFVIRQSLKEIQEKIDTLNILESVCLANSSELNQI